MRPLPRDGRAARLRRRRGHGVDRPGDEGALRALSEHHGLPIASVHAPTLLLTQRVWGTDPWDKVDRSIELALEVGAPTVVLHLPFRWQRDYAASFIDGVALREHDTGIRLAVENMFPWRRRGERCSPTSRTGTRWTSPTTTSPWTCPTPQRPARMPCTWCAS